MAAGHVGAAQCVSAPIMSIAALMGAEVSCRRRARRCSASTNSLSAGKFVVNADLHSKGGLRWGL